VASFPAKSLHKALGDALTTINNVRSVTRKPLIGLIWIKRFRVG